MVSMDVKHHGYLLMLLSPALGTEAVGICTPSLRPFRHTNIAWGLVVTGVPSRPHGNQSYGGLCEFLLRNVHGGEKACWGRVASRSQGL